MTHRHREKVRILKSWVDDFGGKLQNISWPIVRAIIDETRRRDTTTFAHVYFLDDALELVEVGVSRVGALDPRPERGRKVRGRDGSVHLRDWMLFLEEYTLILGPVSTEPPFPVGFDVDASASGERQFRAQCLLITVNLLGLPAVAVPTGLSNEVPRGMQVIGPRYREDQCLDAAQVIEAHCGLETPINPKL